MAENFYSVKTALHVGIVQILGGLISIGIGAFNTRKEDHQAFFKFKPEGLPVWSGILVCIKLNLISCRTRNIRLPRSLRAWDFIFGLRTNEI